MAALIGMMDQARLGPTVIKRHLERVEDELGAHVIGHRPAHDPAREDILNRRQVEPALPGSEIGDVRDPEPVRTVGGERAVDEVLADADPRHADRGAAAPAPDQAADAQRRASAARHACARRARRRRGPARHGCAATIDAAEALVDLGDPGGQALILKRPRGRLARLPGVKPGPAHAQDPAHDRDRVLGLLRRDEPEDPHRVSLSLAKKAAAFFRISRSSARIRFSRRSRRNSSRSSVVRPSACPRRRRPGATSCAATAPSSPAHAPTAGPAGHWTAANGPPQPGTPSNTAVSLASTDILSGRPVGTAIRCPRNRGTPECLEIAAVPLPPPGPHRVRYQTAAPRRSAERWATLISARRSVAARSRGPGRRTRAWRQAVGTTRSEVVAQARRRGSRQRAR